MAVSARAFLRVEGPRFVVRRRLGGNVGRSKSGIQQTVNVTKTHFGTTEGAEVYRYTLTNRAGVEVAIINYGGAITSLKVPDRNGAFGDVVLGFETLDEYVRNPLYFGGLIGRHANRIGMGRFS